MEEGYLKLYRFLNKNKVRYVVIGGIAAVLYGSPRLTKDIDIFIDRNLENAHRLLTAMKEIGFGTAALTTAQRIIENEVTVFKDYFRVDVLTKIKGLGFEKAWKERVKKRINSINVTVISLDNLITSKSAVARSIDLQDIKVLKKLRRRRL